MSTIELVDWENKEKKSPYLYIDFLTILPRTLFSQFYFPDTEDEGENKAK